MNQPFGVVQHERLRDIFEYLNRAVRITNANISDTTVRALINSEFEKHDTRHRNPSEELWSYTRRL
jgi:hypothetical protein